MRCSSWRARRYWKRGRSSSRQRRASRSRCRPWRLPAEEIGVMRVALAGDTMLGRARAIMDGRGRLLDDDVVTVAAEGDAFIVNLECCISDRGSRWPDPAKPFFFRAPPAAAERLAEIGVDCVTLANNHALDYGAQALLDTLGHLSAVGIVCVGAGPDVQSARAPALLSAGCTRLAVVGVSDHPAAFAAGPTEPGIAYADLREAGIGWLADGVADARRGADAVLVSPHWGPNMTVRPAPYIRRAARALLAAGATLVAGHSAHVVHGAERRVLYDLGDFIDDYMVDARVRNDLGFLFLVDLDAGGPKRLEA